MLGLKLIHVSKRGHWTTDNQVRLWPFGVPKWQLTHCPLILHTCLSELGQQWFREWLTPLLLQWRHIVSRMASQITDVSNCLLKCLFRRRSKKTLKPHIAGICEGNPPVTSGFPSQRASDMENVPIWWSHHVGTKPIAEPMLTYGPSDHQGQIFMKIISKYEDFHGRKCILKCCLSLNVLTHESLVTHVCPSAHLASALHYLN